MKIKQDGSKISQKGYDAEILALGILEKLGFEIIYSPELIKRRSNDLPTTEEQTELLDKLETYGFGEQFVDDVGIKTERDKRKLIKVKDVSLTKEQKIEQSKELTKLIGKWEIHQHKIHSIFEEEDRCKTLLTKIIGKSLIPESVRKWYVELIKKHPLESFREFYLKKLENEEINQFTFVDIFCKKDEDYYIFDIKHKTFKEKTNQNRFSVTNYEVLNYDKISKENKVHLKIMIILEKEDKSFYRIFDWSDFTVPSSFDPHVKNKTSVSLREGFDISKLIEI